ncbi:hypothetical protein Bbelb_284630 [Branchiostoma belcheri]|nr:hypothetical protein Bbelb_284630 [Branchiostoma belcheri]
MDGNKYPRALAADNIYDQAEPVNPIPAKNIIRIVETRQHTGESESCAGWHQYSVPEPVRLPPRQFSPEEATTERSVPQAGKSINNHILAEARPPRSLFIHSDTVCMKRLWRSCFDQEMIVWSRVHEDHSRAQEGVPQLQARRVMPRRDSFAAEGVLPRRARNLLSAAKLLSENESLAENRPEWMSLVDSLVAPTADQTGYGTGEMSAESDVALTLSLLSVPHVLSVMWRTVSLLYWYEATQRGLWDGSGRDLGRLLTGLCLSELADGPIAYFPFNRAAVLVIKVLNQGLLFSLLFQVHSMRESRAVPMSGRHRVCFALMVENCAAFRLSWNYVQTAELASGLLSQVLGLGPAALPPLHLALPAACMLLTFSSSFSLSWNYVQTAELASGLLSQVLGLVFIPPFRLSWNYVQTAELAIGLLSQVLGLGPAALPPLHLTLLAACVLATASTELAFLRKFRWTFAAHIPIQLWAASLYQQSALSGRILCVLCVLNALLVFKKLVACKETAPKKHKCLTDVDEQLLEA